ncbi:MAG: hypothetical protein FD137_750 [Spirochaetes bacterium]|nr:MAG: hypothetical protein FD137_750 [Spirochaetota bacterium]
MTKINHWHLILLLILFISTAMTPCFSDATDVIAIGTLVDGAKAFDGKTVVIEGEVVGDVMKRGLYSWICLLDEGIAIGVWTNSAEIPSDLTAGGYGIRGDYVRVSGEFHRACPEHGGDLDIHHMDSFERTAPAMHIAYPIRKERVIVAALFCMMGLLFSLLWKRNSAKG